MGRSRRQDIRTPSKIFNTQKLTWRTQGLENCMQVQAQLYPAFPSHPVPTQGLPGLYCSVLPAPTLPRYATQLRPLEVSQYISFQNLCHLPHYLRYRIVDLVGASKLRDSYCFVEVRFAERKSQQTSPTNSRHLSSCLIEFMLYIHHITFLVFYTS